MTERRKAHDRGEEEAESRHLLDAALGYASLDWAVLPLHAVDLHGRCSCRRSDCKSPGKHPRSSNGVLDATTEGATITEWWSRWPTANIGIATGAASGLVVLDVDPGHGGLESLAKLEAQLGPLPDTLRVETGGGGFHLYFQHPGRGVNIRNAVQLRGLPGLDLRGDGGYVVAPPSRHVSGRVYRFAGGNSGEVAPVPSQLWMPAARLSYARPEAVGGEWSRLLRGVPEGGRHDVGLRLAGHYLGRGLPAEEVQEIVLGFAARCAPPMDSAEAVRIVRDLAAKDAREGGEPNAIRSPKGGERNASNFHPLTAAEILTSTPPELKWLWRSFLPIGTLAILAAYMKVGKSTLVYALALASARGREFLGHATERAGVLILAVEEHPRDVRRRLERFGMTPEDPIFVHCGRLDASTETVGEIREFIHEHEIGLVVLDTLARYWGVPDENDNALIERQISPFLDLAHETDCAVLLVHHTRKAPGREGHEIRGASALFALVDLALILDRRQGGDSSHRVLSTIGRYQEESAEPIVLSYEEATRQAVWEALSGAPQDVPVLVAETGLTVAAVRKALEGLGSKVRREGAGVKGDPYTYRRLDLPFRYQPRLKGKETNAADG